MDRSADKTARWHRGAAPIVYASATPEPAVLEALVHLEAPLVPHALLRLTLREVRVHDVRGLPPDWKARKPLTRDIGDRWLARGRGHVLAVPSALCAEAVNLLVASARLRPDRCAAGACALSASTGACCRGLVVDAMNPAASIRAGCARIACRRDAGIAPVAAAHRIVNVQRRAAVFTRR